MDNINETHPVNCNLIDKEKTRLKEIKEKQMLQKTMFQELEKQK
jgi:hypothetical protein